MDKMIQISKVEQDVLLMLKNEINQTPYRMVRILRDVFVMLLKMIDMDCNEEGKYQNIIERLEQERVPRPRPLSKLKAAVDSCYQGFFRIGYVSTLCYVLHMHLWQSMECDMQTFTNTASALTKVWMTDMAEARNNEIVAAMMDGVPDSVWDWCHLIEDFVG